MEVLVKLFEKYFGDKLFGAQRNPKWRNLRNQFIKVHPKCEVCGKKGKIVHHILPVHKFPALELEEENLISVCRECHFSFCHFFSWWSYNKDIKNDIERIKQRP